MPSPNDLPLPDMTDAVLGADELAALFSDYHACAGEIQIQIKSGPGLVILQATPTLAEAEELLLSRRVRALQLRYEFNGCHWCDTLMQAESGIRLVRIKA